MTLDQLRYFQAVCKYGSISQAAEFMCISQPSISCAIKKLEQEFGTLLFLRENKRLILTEEGLQFSRLADNLLENAEQAQTIMKSLSNGKVLNLGVPPMLGSYILPALYGDLMQQYPDLKINIVEGDGNGLMRLLDESKINMAFLPHVAPFDKNYKAQPLVDLDNVCCMRKDHPLAKCKSIQLDALQTQPLVLFRNSFFQTQRINERFKQLGIEPNVLLHTTQVSTVLNLTASGLVVGFLFGFLLRSTPDLVGIPLDPPMHTQVSLVWKQGEYLNENMNRLIRFVKEYNKK